MSTQRKMKAKPITSAQNRMIWGLVGQLAKQGLGREEAEELLRDIIEGVSGQRSPKALDCAGATIVIDRFKAKVEGRPTKAPPRSKRPTITKRLQRALDQVRGALGFSPREYAAFGRRMLGHPWPQTNDEGIKLYEGMEAMLRRRYHPAWLAPHVNSLQVQARAQDFSTEDSRFVMSIGLALAEDKKLGAGQIGILLKIGERYGHTIPPDPDAK